MSLLPEQIPSQLVRSVIFLPVLYEVGGFHDKIILTSPYQRVSELHVALYYWFINEHHLTQ